METIQTDIEIANPAQRHKRELINRVCVSPHAALSWFPAQSLGSIGIIRLKKRRFCQADGTVISRWTGGAFIRVGSRTTFDEVVFGELQDRIVLGARTLSGLNLYVDPIRRELVDGGPPPAAAA